MRFEAKYNIEGNVLLAPVNGHGFCWFEPKNLDITLTNRNNLYEKGGLVFYNITETEVQYETEDLAFRLENIYFGNSMNFLIKNNF